MNSPTDASGERSGVLVAARDGFLPVEGGSLHYLDWGGAGAPTIIVPAAGLTAGSYASLAQSLRLQLHTTGLDMRGHGTSDAIADPSALRDWEVFYQDLIRFAERHGRGVVLIGHSMGGMVSLVVAARRPDLVRGLVLIEPGIVPPSWIWWVSAAQGTGLWRFVPMIAKASKRRSSWPNREAMATELRRSGRFRRWGKTFLHTYIETGSETHRDGAVHLRCDPAWEARCLATPPTDAWRYVRRLVCPTLVLYGDRSGTFLPSVAARFERDVPHATCVRFPDTGHDLPMERPERTIAEIVGFLKHQDIL